MAFLTSTQVIIPKSTWEFAIWAKPVADRAIRQANAVTKRMSAPLKCWLWFRCRLGLGLSAIAGVAGHHHLPAREVRVNRLGHLNHVPGDFFLRIVIAGKIALDMAVVALDTQTCRKRPHDLDDLVSGRDLEHLQIRWGGPLPLWLLFLSHERQKHQ